MGVGEFAADDYVFHDPSAPEPVRGPDGDREVAETGTQIIDGHIETDQLLTMDDDVARWTRRGTHVGKAGTTEPTDEEVNPGGVRQ